MNYRKKFALLLLIFAIGFIIYFTCGYYTNYLIHKNINLLKSGDHDKQQRAIEKLAEIGEPAVDPLIFALGYDTAHLKSGTMSTLSAILPNDKVKMISNGLEEESLNLKIGVITTLGKIGDKKAIPSLISAIRSKDENIRNEASTALGKIGAPALPELSKLLKNSDVELRCLVIKTLGEIKTRKSAEIVAGCLGESGYSIEEATEKALLNIGEPSVPPLLAILKKQNDDYYITVEVIKILGCLDDPASIEPMAERLHESNGYIRFESATALSKISDSRAALALVDVIDSRDDRLRNIAAEAIRNEYNPLILKKLREKYKAKKAKNRICVIKVLNSLYDPESADLLIRALKDDHYSVRETAAWVLGERVEPGAVKPLISALKDKKPGVRQAAVIALGKIGNPEASPHIVNMLDDSSDWVRFSANDALKYVGDTRDVKQLVKALESKDYFIVMEAIKSLYILEDPDSFIPLVEFLKREKDDKSDRHSIALSAVKGMPTDGIMNELIKLSRDSDPFFRELAVEMLGRTGDPAVMEHIIYALKDKDQKTRISAITALGIIEDRRAIPYVLPLLREKNMEVRRAAIGTLGRVGDKSITKHLFVFLSSDIHYKEAMEAITNIGDGTCMKELGRLQKSKNKRESSIADRAIQRLSQSIDNVKKIERYNHVKESEKLDILRSLSPPYYKKTVVFLFKVAKNDESKCRTEAMERIDWRMNDKYIGILIAYLKDNDPNVRMKAIELLGGSYNKKAVTPLIEILKREKGDIRLEAIKALGELKDYRAVMPLIEVYNTRDNDSKLNAYITYALSRIPDYRSTDILIMAMTNKKYDTIRVTSNALKEIGKIALPKLKRFQRTRNLGKSLGVSLYDIEIQIEENSQYDIYRDKNFDCRNIY